MVNINKNISLNRLEELAKKTILNNLDYFSDNFHLKQLKNLEFFKKKFF
ncbi:MAG: hypothetical protein RBR65_01270 [Aliarcobacter sp.]|jgi:hypothetical protein|nr:hypothetical protein [Aliarcobacter sp.]